VGVAECFPSKTLPWRGIVIIQAKHTNGYNKNFSDGDFSKKTGNASIISKEIPRIKKLRKDKQLDHYMLFSNRRLAGNAESEIREFIAKETGVPSESICLCGVEQIELWLKQFPNVPMIAGIDPVDAPLIVSPDDLAEVVLALSGHQQAIQSAFNNPPTPRVSYDQKNILNNMTAEYAKEQRRLYLKETAQIEQFLAAPENLKLLRLYESVINEFQLKVISKRTDFQTFDKVMEHLIDILFNRDAILRKHKRLTRAILFYMYWICDIGITDDA